MSSYIRITVVLYQGGMKTERESGEGERWEERRTKRNGARYDGGKGGREGEDKIQVGGSREGERRR